MSKKIGMIVLTIGGILLLVGTILIGNKIIKKQEPQKESQKQIQEYVPNIDKNESENLKKQHCLENLCIDELEVITDNNANLSIVSGYLKNQSSQPAPKGYIKIIFTIGTETFEEILYHDEISGNGTYKLEWQHKNEQLVDAIDYKLETPTEEEIKPLESMHK